MHTIYTLLYIILSSYLALASNYDTENELSTQLTYSIISSNQISINIPTSFSPWKSLDVIQNNNRLNLQWESSSIFQNCRDSDDDSTCVNSSAYLDLGDPLDAAATYEYTNPTDAGYESIKYLSPILYESLDGDYNISFVVIIEYNDFADNQYASIDTTFI